jgi:hypothetical protein
MNVICKMTAVVLALGLAACAKTPATGAANDATSVTPTSAALAVDTSLPPIVAFKSPTCGCCELWVEHMRAAGFQVEVKDTQDMGAIKAEAGVPVGQGSCHTAKVGNYYLEGHVPAADVKRLLAEAPDARGLIVPGMVPGSPGMEQGGVTKPYDVLLLAKDGSTTVYSHHGD